MGGLNHHWPFWGLVEQRAALTPDAVFAIDERDRELTFRGLYDRSLAVAAALHARGVGEGTAVSWQLPTWFDSIVLTCALARLGAVQNPIIPIYRGREVRYVLETTQASLFVVPSVWRRFDYEAMAAEIAAEVDVDVLVVSGDGDGGLPVGDASSLPPFSADRPAEAPVRWIYHTSGTTSDPKGARHTDSTLGSGSVVMCERLGITPEDRIALVFPYAHIGGANFLISSLWAGAPLVCVEAFDPATSIPMLGRHRVTLAGAGTAFHLAYLEAQRAAGDRPVLPGVRAFPGGAAPKPVHLHGAMKETFGGTGIVSGYGLTEAPILAMGQIGDPDAKLAVTEGRPSPGVDLRIVGPDGAEQPTGVEGEIQVRGPMVCLGYVDPALTAAAFDAEGFFATGDLGRVDADGYVTVSGRLKDIIIRKGENISAKEVEDLLFEHPDIDDVSVIGLPDAERGERCCAVVVARPGAAALTLDAVAEHLRARELMAQKIPEQLELTDSLPRNPAGKVLKHELRRRFGAGS